jgi:spore coat polysaccharide biosynthesis protein SpsF
VSTPARGGVALVIQARTGSSRLPGKVLAPVAGRPLLRLQLDRLAPLAADHRLVVATSDGPGDDAVAALATDAGADVVRGSEADVLGRFGLVLDRWAPDVVVRLTGDCPLTDPGIVADALALHERTGAAYTSNVHPRSFPKGLDVEVVAAAALAAARSEGTAPDEREHVTTFVHRRPERFPAANLASGDDLGDLWWTVDTAEDLAAIRLLVSRTADPVRASWREVLAAQPPDDRSGESVRTRRPS